MSICNPLVSFNKRVELGIRTGFLEKDSKVQRIAAQVQAAEFFQLFFYGSQALLYALALQGVFSPTIAGICTLSLLPFQAIAYHRSMILYGNRSRHILTVIASTLLVGIAVLSIYKMPGDYAFTMCAGGFVVHIIRLGSEYSDYKKKKIEGAIYQSKQEELPEVCSCFFDSFKNRIEKGKHTGFVTLTEEQTSTRTRYIQAAEIVQLLYFATMAILFGLTLKGFISPLTAGICTLSLLPTQTYANYETMILYGNKSRAMLTAMVTISMAAMGIFAILGFPGDYSWMICLGSLLFHLMRIITERVDYHREVLNNSSEIVGSDPS